jgi:hypothetical protein
MSIGIQSAVGAGPGIQSKVESQERQVWWGHENLRIFDPMPAIKSTAVDSGNTPTTHLRGGLVMAKITSGGLWAEYDPSQTDGRQIARGVLMGGLSMLSTSGAAEQKQGVILIGGLLKASQLLGLDASARQQLSRTFIFDDDIQGRIWGGSFFQEVSKAANYTVVAADNLTEFVATAAVDFTLPAIGRGYRFKFRQTADADLNVISAEGDNIVAEGNATADQVGFATSSEKIGGAFIVYSNRAGDAWVVENASAGNNTVTVTDA